MDRDKLYVFNKNAYQFKKGDLVLVDSITMRGIIFITNRYSFDMFAPMFEDYLREPTEREQFLYLTHGFINVEEKKKEKEKEIPT